MKWILWGSLLLLILIIFACVYARVRVATNFRLIYRRALRVEGRKDIAIAEALRYIAGFMQPFNELSEEDIQFIAKTFSDLENPPGALQPILQHAEKLKSAVPLIDQESILNWKEKLKKENI